MFGRICVRDADFGARIGHPGEGNLMTPALLPQLSVGGSFVPDDFSAKSVKLMANAVSVPAFVFQRAIRLLSVFPSPLRPFLLYTPFVQGHFAKLCRLKTIFYFLPKFSHKNCEKRQQLLPLQSQTPSLCAPLFIRRISLLSRLKPLPLSCGERTAGAFFRFIPPPPYRLLPVYHSRREGSCKAMLIYKNIRAAHLHELDSKKVEAHSNQFF